MNKSKNPLEEILKDDTLVLLSPKDIYKITSQINKEMKHYKRELRKKEVESFYASKEIVLNA